MKLKNPCFIVFDWTDAQTSRNQYDPHLLKVGAQKQCAVNEYICITFNAIVQDSIFKVSKSLILF